ncbi:MAG TPA: TonB family protein [Burkholderiales bacterium]|nr:TonB family protein [Burkholderiales bacterium]
MCAAREHLPQVGSPKAGAVMLAGAVLCWGALSADCRAQTEDDLLRACAFELSQEIKRRFTPADFPDELRRAGVEGIVSVRLTVSRGGAFGGSSLVRSSGNAVLDIAALRLMGRLFPPSSQAPAECRLGTEFDLTLPLRFFLLGSAAGR